MTDNLERQQSCVRVALKLEQPWDITGDLADCWLAGTLGDNGQVILEMPIELEGCKHVSVIVQPRYGSDNFAHLSHGQPIVVDQKIETPDGDLFLIGSIRQPRA